MSDAGTGWSDDRVELLSKLWADGLSASQIAAQLGGGVTRNAVIGKVHRLGLSGRVKPGTTPAARQPAKARASLPPPGTADAARLATHPDNESVAVVPAGTDQRWASEEVAIPVSERVSILELRESMCRWPLGDPSKPDFGFCGARSVTGLPYCAHHSRIAYQPATERRRLRA